MIHSRFALGLAAMLGCQAICIAAQDTITLIAGRELHVQFVTELSTKANESGDMWTGKVVEPMFGNGGEIVPDGSTVDGHIIFVNGPSQAKAKTKDKEKGDMLLVADSISLADGTKYNIVSNAGGAPGAPTKELTTGPVSVPARNFSTKTKTILIPQGTEVTFPISHDVTATKVPVKQ